MATELFGKPEFDILQEYVIPRSAREIYTKLNNHHGDQFGKCKITTAGAKFKIAKIHILAIQGHKELTGKVTLAIWGEQGNLKIRNAHEGKTTLKGISILLVETDELPLYIQQKIT
jgi:hypothetical protein